MLGKIILAILFVLLLVVLLTPACLRISYREGKLCVTLKYAAFALQLVPGKEKTIASDKVEKTLSSDEVKAVSKEEKAKVNKDQILYTIETLPTVLVKALRRTGKRIRIEPLMVHLLVAGPDPADTAILYGKIEGALAAVLPVIHKKVRIREQDIRLFPDFCEERMDCIADVGVVLRPWDVLVIGLCALGGVLKWYIGFRKRATKLPKSMNKSMDTTAQTGDTVS